MSRITTGELEDVFGSGEDSNSEVEELWYTLCDDGTLISDVERVKKKRTVFR